jgi:hypothetical protein
LTGTAVGSEKEYPMVSPRDWWPINDVILAEGMLDQRSITRVFGEKG